MVRFAVLIALVATLAGCATTRTDKEQAKLRTQLDRDSQSGSICSGCGMGGGDD